MNTMLPRVGIGHDAHRLVPGDGLRLGGVWIPHSKSLLGHSDADALLHATTDALLGAAGLGDIGEMFPDTDAANKDRSSVEMLRLAYKKLRESGWVVHNVDCIVFAERPKLSEYKSLMASRIAETLEITPQQVNVKAKTGEGVGLVGEELVIEAQCVVLIVRDKCATTNNVKTLAASRPLTASVPPQSVVVCPRASLEEEHTPKGTICSR